MRVIEVSDVKPAEKSLEALDREAAVRSMLKLPIEQLGEGAPLVICTDVHALAEAANESFYRHRPLVLSPDMVWFCIAQGFATHVSLNAEALRGRLGIQHEGKKKLVVVRDDFFIGQKNPWPEAFDAFGVQIGRHVGKLRDLVAGSFSTTGPVERAAFDVLVMETFSPYFEYEMLCGCGIPRVLLTGTVDDWRSVRRRAAMLSEFDLVWWADVLLPVLDEVVRSAEGNASREFWQSFFRYESGSGPAELTGWVQTLFPYLLSRGREKVPVRSKYLAQWQHGFEKASKVPAFERWDDLVGPSLGELPASVASAEVKVIDARDGSEKTLRFVGGMFGVSSEDGAMRAEFGWAVVHDAPGGVPAS